MPTSVPPSLTALGRGTFPGSINTLTSTYKLSKAFKNDFFAATALYEGADGKVILKIQRTAPFGIVPLRWVGRFLAKREISAMERLADVVGIPAFLEPWNDTGIIREYIEGEPLAKGKPVPDDFHARLRETIDEIHRRGMAYVDLEKCENVLLGSDGLPYLFDFQISWLWPKRWGGELWPLRIVRRWFQRGDLYHLQKLRRRTRPDQMTQEELEESYRKPWYVQCHTKMMRPLLFVRRKILLRVDPRRKVGERGRIIEDDAPRNPQQLKGTGNASINRRP